MRLSYVGRDFYYLACWMVFNFLILFIILVFIWGIRVSVKSVISSVCFLFSMRKFMKQRIYDKALGFSYSILRKLWPFMYNADFYADSDFLSERRPYVENAVFCKYRRRKIMGMVFC